jgi:uncharacterized membrane protein
MKLFYELEDSVVGIIAGVLLLSYSGIVKIQVPYMDIVLPTVLGVFLVMNVLDVKHFLKDMHENVKLSLVSFAINIIDIVINLAFISKMLSIELPFISDVVWPYTSTQYVPVAASYIIFVNIIWIYWYHKK